MLLAIGKVNLDTQAAVSKIPCARNLGAPTLPLAAYRGQTRPSHEHKREAKVLEGGSGPRPCNVPNASDRDQEFAGKRVPEV